MKLIITLLLLNLANASAISLHTDLGNFIINEAKSDGAADYSNVGVIPSWITVASAGGSLSASLFSFTNSTDQAVWSGQQALVASGSDSLAKVNSAFRLLLSEPVNYSVTGGWLFTNLNAGASATSFARLEMRNYEQDGSWDDLYQESDLLTTAFGSTQFGDSATIGSNTGSLDPGSYYLSFQNSIINGGFGVGEFAFTFSRPVPEAGSTLMLLGLAVGVIGIYRRAL